MQGALQPDILALPKNKHAWQSAFEVQTLHQLKLFYMHDATAAQMKALHALLARACLGCAAISSTSSLH